MGRIINPTKFKSNFVKYNPVYQRIDMLVYSWGEETMIDGMEEYLLSTVSNATEAEILSKDEAMENFEDLANWSIETDTLVQVEDILFCIAECDKDLI